MSGTIHVVTDTTPLINGHHGNAGGTDTPPTCPSSPTAQQQPLSARRTPLSRSQSQGRRAPSSSALSSSAFSADSQQYDSLTQQCAAELRAVASLAAPYGATYLLYFSFTIAVVAVVGHLGPVELASVALSVMLVSIIGSATIVGVCSSFDTLIAQTFGNNATSPAIALHVQRGLAFALLLCAPLAVVLYFTEDIVRAMGVASGPVAEHVGRYTKVAIAALPAYAVGETATSYFGSMGSTLEMLLSSGITAVANVILLVLMVHHGVGWMGGVASWVTSMYIYALVVVGVSKFVTRTHEATWQPWSRRALSGWGPMLRLAFPAWIMMLCEWSAFEINGVLASALFPVHEFAAFAIVLNLCHVTFPIPLGIMLACATRVGNYVGALNPRGARVSIGCAALLMFAVFTVDFAVLYGAKDVIGGIFTNDDDVRRMVGELMPYFVLFHFADIFMGIVTNVARALGHQAVGAAMTIVGWGGGVTCGWCMAHYWHWGPKALWIGPTIGLATSLAFGIAFMLRVDFSPVIELDDGAGAVGEPPRHPF